MTWKPDVTVAAVVEREGRFLLVEERVAAQLVFNQPAGHVEAGESLLEAAVRETLEETAWTFVPSHFLGIYLWQPVHGPRSFLRLAFIGEVTVRDPQRPLDRGIRRALWMSRDELSQRSDRLRSPMVLSCIDDYLAGRRYPLEMINQIGSPAEMVQNAQSVG